MHVTIFLFYVLLIFYFPAASYFLFLDILPTIPQEEEEEEEVVPAAPLVIQVPWGICPCLAASNFCCHAAFFEAADGFRMPLFLMARTTDARSLFKPNL